MKEMKITREELYEMVWNESLLSLTKKYNISDNGLRKKCKKMGIPLPSLGYWARVQFGTKVPERIPLGKHLGDQYTYLKIREEGDPEYVSAIKQISILKDQIEIDPRINLKVSDRLTDPDLIIASIKDDLYKKSIWQNKNDRVYNSGGIILIHVSAKNVGRALRFMDCVIKGIKGRGHQIKVKGREVYIVAFGEELVMSCWDKENKEYSKTKNIENNTKTPEYLLCLSVADSYDTKYWYEDKKPLEDQISRIIATIEYKCQKKKQERIEREKRWEIEREKERNAKELQDRKEKELNEFKEIFKKSKRHEKAEGMRRYAQLVENRAISINEFTDEVKRSVEWIRKKADWYDPFIEAYDELLNDIDREELVLHKQTFYWLNR